MKWWNDYWFRPAPYVDLAMARIIVVGVQLALLLFYPTYSNEWLRQWAEMPAELYQPLPVLRLLLLPFGWGYRPSLEELELVYYVTLVGGVCGLLGIFTNVGLAVLTLGTSIIVAHTYSYGEFHHPEAPLVIALGLLTLSPSGRVLSLDSLRRRRTAAARERPGLLDAESTYAAWPLLVIQWLFVLIYLSAVFSKLFLHGGLEWLNGYTLQYYMIQDSIWRGSPLGLWFAQHHMLVYLGQIAVVLFQTTFVLAVLFPKLRWFYVPMGIGFHIANILLLNAIFFEWLALYAVFIPWRRLFQLVAARRETFPAIPRGAA